MDFVQTFNWTEYLGVLLYFPLCMLGLMLHFLKKKVKTEDFIEVKAYFTSHRVSTLTTVLSALVLLYIFDSMGQLNVVSAIMAGYATDSLFQKQVDAMVMRDPTNLNRSSAALPGGGYQPTGTGRPQGPPPQGGSGTAPPSVTPGGDEPEEGA